MKIKYFIAIISTIALPFSQLYAQEGGQLFRSHSGLCYTVGKGKLVGPDLKSIQDKHPEAWILKWVHSSQTLVKLGDKDAVKLFNGNNLIVMPDQALSDNDIKTILAYIKTGGEPLVTATNNNIPAAGVQSTGTDNISAAAQKTADDAKSGSSLIDMFGGFTNYPVMFLMGIMLIVIWVLALALKSLTEQLRTKPNQ